MTAALRLSFCVASTAIVAACASAPKALTPEEMVAGADALDRQYVDAFNRDDADALMETYWRDPRMVSIGVDGSIPQGWEGVSAAWHESMDGNPDSRLEFIESHNVPIGEVVVGYGLWRITRAVDSGPPEVLEGPYSDVKAFRNGRWVRMLDHASVATLE